MGTLQAVSMEGATTLIDFLRKRGEDASEQSLFRFVSRAGSTEESLTGAELWQEASSLASRLSTYPPGTRVVLIFPAGLDFIRAFYGCLCADLIAVPVAFTKRSSSVNRIGRIISNCHPLLVLTTGTLLPFLRKEFSSEGQFPFLQILELNSVEAPLAPPPHQSAVSSEVESLAFLQYTSGSTSEPKGVMISHDNVIQNCQTISARLNVTTHSRIVSWLPHYHDMGLISAVVLPVVVGCPVVSMSPEEFIQRPQVWLKTINAYGGTHAGGPTSRISTVWNESRMTR